MNTQTARDIAVMPLYGEVVDRHASARLEATELDRVAVRCDQPLAGRQRTERLKRSICGQESVQCSCTDWRAGTFDRHLDYFGGWVLVCTSYRRRPQFTEPVEREHRIAGSDAADRRGRTIGQQNRGRSGKAARNGRCVRRELQ